jgi:hypothetical protein
VALLAVYVAGLIFVAQHIAERYAPALYPVVVRKIGLPWLGIMAVIATATLVLTLFRLSLWTNIIDAVLFAAALSTLILGLYLTFGAAANRERVLAMAGDVKASDRVSAFQDLLWSSASRGDVTGAEYVLSIPKYGSSEQAGLLGWVTQYPQLLQQPWFTQAVLKCLTHGELDAVAAERLRSAFRQLLVCTLNVDEFSEANEIVLAILRAVEEASAFTEYHRYVVFDVGFHTHMVGEEGLNATPRIGQPAASLREVQEYFLAELSPLREAVLRHRDPEGVTQFAYRSSTLAIRVSGQCMCPRKSMMCWRTDTQVACCKKMHWKHLRRSLVRPIMIGAVIEPRIRLKATSMN